jgi:hypothetical protein
LALPPFNLSYLYVEIDSWQTGLFHERGRHCSSSREKEPSQLVEPYVFDSLFADEQAMETLQEKAVFVGACWTFFSWLELVQSTAKGADFNFNQDLVAYVTNTCF